MSWQHIFINPQRHILRSGWRVTIFFFLWLSFLFVLGRAARLVMTGGDLTQDPSRVVGPLGLIFQSLLLIIAPLIATVVCLRAFDGRPWRCIGYQLHAGWWRDYLVGTGVAAVMITAVVGIEWIAGALSLNWSSAPAGELFSGLVVSFVFFNTASAFEELSFRGYPLQTLLQDVHPAWAVIITSMLFSLAHSVNPHASILGLLNTVLAGIWLAVAYLKTRSLWLCTSLHWAWNWTMNAIYGLNVSGLEGMVKNPLVGARQTGSDWLTGGSYGPEGGLLVTAVVSLGTLILWRAHWRAPAQDFSVVPGQLSGVEEKRMTVPTELGTESHEQRTNDQ